MPERFDFWGIPHSWGPPELYVYSLMGLAALILFFRFYQRASLWWKVGRKEARWDQFFARLGKLTQYAVVQTKVLRQKYPGIMHLGIAWGFFVFFLGTALATINSHFFKFLEGNIYLLYKFFLDIFTIFFLIGAVLAAYRRYAQKPDRLTLELGFHPIARADHPDRPGRTIDRVRYDWQLSVRHGSGGHLPDGCWLKSGLQPALQTRP